MYIYSCHEKKKLRLLNLNAMFAGFLASREVEMQLRGCRGRFYQNENSSSETSLVMIDPTVS